MVSIRKVSGSELFAQPIYEEDGSIRSLWRLTDKEHTIPVPAKAILKKLIPKKVAELMTLGSDLEYGYRVHAEYEVWEVMEHVEGVIYDTSPGAKIGDIVSGPFPVRPSVRATGDFERRPTGKTRKEWFWKVCSFGNCTTIGGWD